MSTTGLPASFPSRISALLASLVLSAAPALSQGQVWVVAAAGGGDYTSLQLAAADAASGDTLLVKAGSYSLTFVTGKSLTIVGEEGVLPQVQYVRVTDLSAGQHVELRGLRLGQSLGDPALTVANCQGPVSVEDCALIGGMTFFSGLLPATEGLRAQNSVAVSLARCQVTGGAGGAPGLHVAGASVFLYDCDVTGGLGAPAGPSPGGMLVPSVPGGDGARIADGFAFASGTTLRAGNGGNGTILIVGGCMPPTDGGHGLHLTGAGASAQLLDSTAIGGAGGVAAPGCPGAGAPGQPEFVAAGTLLPPFAGSARSFSTNAPVREGQTLTETFAGAPGDLVILGVSPSAGAFYLPAFSGALLLGPPLFVFAKGVVPASGTLVSTLTIGELGLGVEAALVPMQSAHCDAGGCVLGPPSTVVLLDAAF